MNGCIYYTSNDIDSKILSICQEQLRKAWSGEIISVSLKPIDFGTNIVLENRVKSYPTMTDQIITALEASTADNVFFTEHDVLYHPSHFEFTPEKNDIYYYNINNWRWRYPLDTLINYDDLTSLSGMCCNRELAIKHYKLRKQKLEELGEDPTRQREPRWARRFGYEPGTKKIKRGGLTNEDFAVRRSRFPNVDIRHNRTFTRPKTFLFEFKHPPKGVWNETTIDNIPGWELRKMFNL